MVDLVTGGAGFIGRHVVRRLVERGAQVRVLDRRGADGGCADGVEVVSGSVNDPAVLERATAGVERVFHVAGNPQLWAAHGRDFVTDNVETTRAVLEASARRRARRVVVTSTAAIHFARRNGAVDTARMPGAYCRSKYLTERAALRAAADGLPVVIVNPCLPVGPGDRRLTPPTRMIVDFLNLRTQAYLDFDLRLIDVSDLARGYLMAAERGEPGQRYFLGGDLVRLSSVLAMLEGMSGRRMPRLRVPYGLAYAAGLVSELIADGFTRRPPAAPLAGVRLARRPPMPDGLKTHEDLGLELGPIEPALAEEVRWLDENGYLDERLERPVTAPARDAPARDASAQVGR